MPTLTIGRMAKLYGLHRSTLYEAVARGRVTAGVNGKGQREIDLSEMIRVYGEPPGQARQNPTPSPDAPDTTAQAMLEELRALRLEVEQLLADLRRLPPPEAPREPPHGAQADTPTHDDPHGLRSLVRALRTSGVQTGDR